MRRILTTASAGAAVAGVVIAATPALVMAATPPVAHRSHRPPPTYSLIATATPATIRAGDRATIIATIKDNTARSQPGELMVHWQHPATAGRLAVLAAHRCAYQSKTAMSVCFFTVKAGATTSIRLAARGVTPGTTTAALIAIPSKAGASSKTSKTAKAGTDVATASVKLHVTKRPQGVHVGLTGPARASRGQTVRYIATATNPSNAAVQSVRLLLTFPRGLGHLSVGPRSKNDGCSVAGRVVTCTFSKIAPAHSESVTVQAAITSPVSRHASVRTPAKTPAKTAGKTAGKTAAAPAKQGRLQPLAGSAASHAGAKAVTLDPPAAKQDPQASRLTVTARITHVMCWDTATINASRDSRAAATTVLAADTPASPMVRPGARHNLTGPAAANRQDMPGGGPPGPPGPGRPGLPMTGAPLLQALAAAVVLLGAGILALVGARTRGRRAR
jgi:hypothetical protein